MKEGECVTEMKMEEKETYVRRERERESTATSGDKE